MTLGLVPRVFPNWCNLAPTGRFRAAVWTAVAYWIKVDSFKQEIPFTEFIVFIMGLMPVFCSCPVTKEHNSQDKIHLTLNI